MTKPILTRLLCFLIAVFSVTACLHDSDDDAPEPEPQPQPEPEPPAWSLIWSDEFDSAIDAEKWNFEVNCWGGGNNEQQCYTSRSDNAFVEDGILHIVAIEEPYSGPALQDEHPDYDPNDTSASRNYTSARMRTRGLFEFTYGRVEIRAQLPGGQGAWPALWMLPTENVYGGWPSSGEIDIMEAVNLDTAAANEVHGTLHYGLPWPQWSNNGAAFTGDLDYTNAFHIYTLEWEADEIRWFVDGTHYQTQRSEGWYNYIWQGQNTGFAAANPQAPYDQNFHLLMNLAIGGDWPGAPDSGWLHNREFLIDYVRVYQCDSQASDGTGCASATDAIEASVVVNEDAGAPQENVFGYFDGTPQSIPLEFDSATLNAPLVANVWQETEGNVVTAVNDIGGDHGEVWDITFNGLGNVFLTVGDLATEGLQNALALSGGTGWTTNGELSFDLYIESIDTGTGLLAKLDSGYPNLGQLEIELPAAGEWARVHIRIADLLANPLAGGSGLNVNRIQNMFVLEPTGTHSARVYIDNIQLQCAVNPTAQSWQSDKECGIAPVEVPVAPVDLNVDVLNIFEEEITHWDLFDCCGGTTIAIVEDEVEPARGNVVEFSYSSDTTVTYFQSAAPLDLNAWAGGTLEFDLYIEAEPENAQWVMKVECEFPCGSGDVPLAENANAITPALGVWQHYVFDIDDLVSRGLELNHLNTPLVIFPSWGNQAGAVFRIDNVRLVKAESA